MKPAAFEFARMLSYQVIFFSVLKLVFPVRKVILFQNIASWVELSQGLVCTGSPKPNEIFRYDLNISHKNTITTG